MRFYKLLISYLFVSVLSITHSFRKLTLCVSFVFLLQLSLRANYINEDYSFSHLNPNISLEDYSLVQTYPENNGVFESTTTSADVKWQWGSASPVVTYYFKVEYTINGSSYTSANLASTVNSYNIGFTSGSEVKWRVYCVDESNNVIYTSLWFVFSVIRGTHICVKSGALGSGSSWSDAIDLQDALNKSVYGDEIWVAAGTYKPTLLTDRTVSFEIKEGVTIYGGFAGSETLLTQRNWIKNKTILSGDIGVEDVNSDNSYNVIRMTGTSSSPITNNTILNGVIVECGYANIASQNHDSGAGLLLLYASPLVVNSWLRDNYSLNYGGAVQGNAYSQAKFYNSLFTNNISHKYGGAVFANAEMYFVNCLFYANQATNRGGAINGPESPGNVYVYNSILWNNSASSYPELYNAIVGYSVVEGGYTGVSMLSDDPQMLDPDANDFRVNSRSEVINVGSDDYVPDWLLVDYAGNSRIGDSRVDIGLYEGSTETPFPLYPVKNQLFDATVTSVDLQWSWDASVPASITGYAVEYYVNDEAVTRINNIAQLTYTLTGLASIDKIYWRVAAISGSDEYFWSPWTNFFIKRDCPLYVKVDATGSGNSWSDAINLQDALELSVWGDEIWIASGTYKPTDSGDCTISFELKDGIKVYGGFSGSEASVDDRDNMSNKTILSGDIGVADVLTDNSYHVIKAIGTTSEPITSETILDGVIVEKGNAQFNTGNNQNAGGLYLISASPKVVNTWFRNNYSLYQGGAVYGDGLSNPVFANVIFSNNNSGQNGGAVYSNASMIFYNCLWYNNYSAYWGGAAYASTNNTTLVYNSISWGNSAQYNYSDFRNLLVRSSLVEDGSGISSITTDPLFVDADVADFKLQEESPAYNSGNISYIPSWLLTDFAGDKRIISDIVDMGPFEMEYIPDSTPIITDDINNLVVWPNPVISGETLSVTMGTLVIGSYQIMDVLGKTILKQSNLDVETLSIQINFIPGVYILTLETVSGKMAQAKLMVK